MDIKPNLGKYFVTIIFILTSICPLYSMGCQAGNCTDGEGVYVNSDGSRHLGVFKNGSPNGTGVLIAEDGGIKLGKFVNGRPGDDIFTANYKKLSTEAGCFSGDCLNGLSVYKNANGHTYIGHFQDGEAHGLGAYFYGSGKIYLGYFDHDYLQGHGIFLYTSGDIWAGEMFQGDRHGFGTIYWTNGNIWMGNFTKDDRDGLGLVKYESTNPQFEIYKDGEFVERLGKFMIFEGWAQTYEWEEFCEVLTVLNTLRHGGFREIWGREYTEYFTYSSQQKYYEPLLELPNTQDVAIVNTSHHSPDYRATLKVYDNHEKAIEQYNAWLRQLADCYPDYWAIAVHADESLPYHHIGPPKSDDDIESILILRLAKVSDSNWKLTLDIKGTHIKTLDF